MYRVRLEEFEGPLDLLLFFIRRDELDIFNIPIAKIADEYLSYVQLLQEVDLDYAGEFVYMAAVLISIKTKMLLPRPEVDDEGEVIDPRKELVERLLEYIRFKEASEQLQVVQEKREGQFVRGAASAVAEAFAETEETSYRVSVFGLISALQRVLKQVQADAPYQHHVLAEEFTIEEQAEYLMGVLKGKGRLSFVDLMRNKTKSFIITTFLAILELARAHQIHIAERVENDDFFIEEMTIIS